EGADVRRDLVQPAFLADALIVAGARIASGEPHTAAALAAVADGAGRELMLELDPVELGVRAAVENELRGTYRIALPGDASEDDLLLSLEAATVRALDALAALASRT